MNTTQTAVTEKTIGAFEARRYFGEVIDEVKKGNKFVITEHGKDVAAVVPLEIYEQWKKERDTFFALLQDMQTTANLSEKEAMQLANEAVKAVRAEARAAKKV